MCALGNGQFVTGAAADSRADRVHYTNVMASWVLNRGDVVHIAPCLPAELTVRLAYRGPVRRIGPRRRFLFRLVQPPEQRLSSADPGEHT